MLNPADELSPINNYQVNQEKGDNQPAEDIAASEIPNGDIHTMPQRFLKPPKLAKQKGQISWLILGILIFVVLAIVIGVVIIFLRQQTTPSVPLSGINEPAAVNQPVNTNANQNENENINQNVNEDLTTPQERDEQRLADITSIRTALALYFADQNSFPNSLNTLIGQYLTVLPQNPLPGGETYNYQVSDDQQNYQLAFTLESGGLMGVVRLAAGSYVAVVERVMTKSEFEANQNVNVNLNQNQNENVNINPPLTLPTLGLDSDGDQLTDIEENIYQTSSALADTDNDGYTDATEILNFYDPTTANGRLMESELIAVYQNQTFNYSLLYPQTWVTRSLTADNKEVIFTSSTGEFVEIIVQENPLTLSAYNWYLNQNPGVDTTGLKSLLIDGLPAIQTPDSLNTFLAVGTKIFAITYNIGMGNQMNFSITYQLFLKSFMFITPTTNQ